MNEAGEKISEMKCLSCRNVADTFGVAISTGWT
jgi:transposase